MVRMPTAEELGIPSVATPGVPRRLPDNISPAIERAGDRLDRFGQQMAQQDAADSDLDARIARRQKAEADALDLARANSDWTVRRLTEAENATLEKQPDSSKWQPSWDQNVRKQRDEVAKTIRDPVQREKFIAQSEEDIARGSFEIKGRATTIDREKREAEAITGLDASLTAAAKPGLPKDESKAIIARAHADLDNLLVSGTITPARHEELRRGLVEKFSVLKLDWDKQENPARTKAWLEGSDYYSKLDKQEGRTKNATSSADGYYQFLEGTWADVMKRHPELGLTKDGRKNRDQADRAVRAFTADNEKALKAAGIPVNEANLYLAHFMGSGGAIKMLSANPNQDATKAFPDAAAANPTIFNGRTVGEVIALQTQGFSGDYGPAPDYYSVIPAEQAQSALIEVTKVVEKEEQDKAVMDAADYILTTAKGDLDATTTMISEIKDPNVRKDVAAIVDAEHKRRKQADEESYDQAYEKSFGTVSQALNAGDPAAAMKAIDPNLKPTDQDKLREHIRKGAVREDKQAVVDRLTAMWMDNPQEFARLKLTDNINDLTTSTLAQFKARQDAVKKGEETPEDKTIRTTVNQANSLVTDYIQQIGIVTSGTKQKPRDIKYANAVRSIVVKELEKLQAQLGRQPSVGEVDDLVKSVFKAYPTTADGWFGKKEVEMEFDEVFDAYDEKGWDYEAAAGALRKAGRPVTAASLMELYELRAAQEGN